MSERVIGRYMRHDKNATNRHQIMPAPEAPSVAEVVEVLKKARCALRRDRHGDAVHAQMTKMLERLGGLDA